MGYLTVNELKDYLKVSKSSIYKWCSSRTIPHIKRGKSLMFKKDEIDCWLDNQSVPTCNQIEGNISQLIKATKGK